MFNRFDRIPGCDGQTDGRTDGHLATVVRAMHRAVENTLKSSYSQLLFDFKVTKFRKHYGFDY